MLNKMQKMQTPRKQRVRGAVKTSTTSSALYSVYVVLAYITMLAQPNEMQKSAVKS